MNILLIESLCLTNANKKYFIVSVTTTKIYQPNSSVIKSYNFYAFKSI